MIRSRAYDRRRKQLVTVVLTGLIIALVTPSATLAIHAPAASPQVGWYVYNQMCFDYWPESGPHCGGDPGARPSVSITVDYEVDGQPAGSESWNDYDNYDWHWDDVYSAALGTFGSYAGYHSTQWFVSWAWGFMPITNASTFYGFWAISAGPYIGGALAAGAFVY